MLSGLRETVFVHEQGVPIELEIDEFDPRSLHLLAEYGDLAVGTGRLLEDGHIGRLAVLCKYRGLGVGKALLMALIGEARNRGFGEAVLSAQVHAIPFYERAGFTVCGPEFLDAGIPHREMRLPLKAVQ
ncbi:GNAT family N-acetyltransferase [Acidihalobacter aeolianus]|uniref:GNAT family N-acetyltransferase n=1 Tax=Acidihalobacter aeolianus TaxID=2792603 RepID=UPI001E487555|nr:GNAT family N-acetyltransferase [Acidihalobacter aeolianus]